MFPLQSQKRQRLHVVTQLDTKLWIQRRAHGIPQRPSRLIESSSKKRLGYLLHLLIITVRRQDNSY
jgi:hypothetical protein